MASALVNTIMEENSKEDDVHSNTVFETAVEGTYILHKAKVEKPHEQAIIVLGEASESEEEEEEEIMTDSSPTAPVQGVTRMSLPLTSHYVHPPLDQRSPSFPDSTKCKSLLHTKLRERNAALRKRIVQAVQQPYQTIAKDLNNLSQQLVKTQSHIQELSPILRLLTNELFQLEDKLEITMDCSSLIPNINIDDKFS